MTGKIWKIANFPILSEGDQGPRRFAAVNEDPSKIRVTGMDASGVGTQPRGSRKGPRNCRSLHGTPGLSLLANENSGRGFAHLIQPM
jgi:hypothetical protein